MMFHMSAGNVDAAMCERLHFVSGYLLLLFIPFLLHLIVTSTHFPARHLGIAVG